MPVSLECPYCQFSAMVKDRHAGKKVACPKCHQTIQLPKVSVREIPAEDIMTGPGGFPWKHPLFLGTVCLAVILVLVAWQFSNGLGEAEPRQPNEPVASGTENSPARTSSQTDSSPISEVNQSPIKAPAQDVGAKEPDVKLAQTQPMPADSVITQEPDAAPTSAEVESELSVPADFEFEFLTLDEPVTFMAMSENGRLLFLSHQGANQVTVYDVFQNSVVDILETPSPRDLLPRGSRLFVGNSGESTISVYEEEGGAWSQVNELSVDHPNIVHMSAPQGRNFSNELVVTCHGAGSQASYRDCHVFHVDIESDRCKEVARSALASYSHDGKLIVTQGSFNLSPSGGLSAFNAQEFLSGAANPIFRGGIPQTPYVYQVYPGSYWMGANLILGGNPLGPVQQDLDRFLVADQTQKLVYVVHNTHVTAHQLNSGFAEVGKRKASFPAQYKKDFSPLYHRIYRRRGYLLDRPVAATHSNQLFTFLLDIKTGAVLRAVTTPFQPLATIAQSDQDNSKTPENPGHSPPAQHSDESASLTNAFADLPHYVPAGQSWQATLVGTDIEFKLMTGPMGLTLSDGGNLRWRPEESQIGVHETKWQLRRNGQQVFHRQQFEVVRPELFERAGGDPQKINEFATIPVEVDRFYWTDSHDHDAILLLQGNGLRILSKDGTQTETTRTLPERYKFIQEREDVYICAKEKPAAVDVVNRRTLKVTKHIPIELDVQIQELTDLEVHPRQDKCYVAIKKFDDLPHFMVVEVNEKSGTASLNGMFGNWIKATADGRRVFTGYKDIYQNGVRFHINPGWRLIDIPEYGNIDMIIEWSTSTGDPLQVIGEAGGNGNGLRLSPDERRIVYLSHVGFPLHSGNLTGFDAGDFSKPVVRYETNQIATTKELAFHPKLPWVAVPTEHAAVLFDQETGKPIENRLLCTSQGLGDVQIEQLKFSPDGTHLLFLCSTVEGKFLKAIPIKLSEDERNRRRPVPAKKLGPTA